MKVECFDQNHNSLGTPAANDGLSETFQTWCIDDDMIKQSGDFISVKFTLPIIDIHGFWSAEMLRPQMKLDWRIEFSSAAQRNFPYLVFFNQNQINRGSFASTNLIDDTVISARMNQQSGNYEIEFMIAVSAATESFLLFADDSEREWPVILDDYRSVAVPGDQPAFPDAAWQPVYCTWYAVHAALDRDWLETQTGLASELGFGTFIVDDGWCFDERKRVTPETIGNWYETIGDWQVSAEKLPDFREHVERARTLGLKYLLWTAPFMIGSKSDACKSGRPCYLSDEHEGYRVFDPADRETAAVSIEHMADLMNEYKLDGLKIDFLDTVPVSLQNPRGRAAFAYITSLSDRIRQVKEDALIEFRQRYTTPLMMTRATQFRAGDVPFDFIENLHRIGQIRICLGDRVPVHADPAYWHAAESVDNVSRHMICAIAAVPMVSMDLQTISPDHLAVINHWLDFYQQHLETFSTGNWQVRYEHDHLAYIAVTGKTGTIVFLVDPGYASQFSKVCHGELQLLNISHNPIAIKNTQAYDGSGRKSSAKGLIPPAGRGLISRT